MERPSRKSCTYPNRYRLVIGLITALGFVVGSTDSIEARPRPSQPARPALDQAAEQSTTVPSFTEIATNPASGLAYARGASPINAVIDDLRQRSLIAPLVDGVDFELPELPLKTHGQPGVAILDYDDDGDLDLYVTNGPGVGNSLFSNLLSETGEVTFVDVAAQAGVAATAQDSMGVCYGDIDNDDDHDLLVLGRSEPNRFFVNQGNGTFTEAADSGLEGGDLGHSSCSMGDVNGDGLLDVFVANVWDLDNLRACFTVPFAESHHNQLFINQGDGTFTDTSATSGIEDLAGLPPEAAGSATLTWAVGLLDIDLDGDIDIILGDDQCALGEERFGGVDRGFLHVLLNDGTGHFVDEAFLLHHQASSSWMGLAFGDLNCDGNLDVFGSNFGDYDDAIAAPFPYELGDQTTRWLLGNGDGSWTDPTIGQIASVFGWGNGIFDYDNDGDQDVVYHGGLDLNFFHAEDNPGVLLENQGCSAEFVTRVDAFPTDHQRRTVQGVALGDLDRNGFVDVVSVSNVDMPQALPLLPNPTAWDPQTVRHADVLNPVARFVPSFATTAEGLVWSGVDLLPGSLSVELNGGNSHRWVEVTARGSVGTTPDGTVNRDGIGAVITFTPQRKVAGQGVIDGSTVMTPVMGGSSLGSQHSLAAEFGLGTSRIGRVEIIWPGGVRNRLYGVRASERILLPEIPCSYDADWSSAREYSACVARALEDLVEAEVLTRPQSQRLRRSAIRAFFDR